jgi:hypothetical protein
VRRALQLAAASLIRQTAPTVKTTKEKASIKTSRRMGKNGKLGKKSQLALAAKKCRPIGNYFVRKISTTSAKDPPEVFVYDDDIKPPPERHTDLLPTQSEDDRDEACKMTATRSVSTASTTFVAENATTTRSMLKYPTEVFDSVVNEDDKKTPLPFEWTQLGKSPTDSFDVVEIEEVKWGMRICICGCQEIADPTTSVLFHDEHGDNQAWLSEEFDTLTDYSIKLVPIRIPSNLKHVEMYWEAAREMRSLPEYRIDYVFVDYLIHLMTQEVNCDNMLQSIVIQVTLCSTKRLGASMSEYGWTNKGNSEKSPSEEVGDIIRCIRLA